MNEHKFDKKGEIYFKARPSYLDKLFIYLKDQNLISKSTASYPYITRCYIGRLIKRSV